MELTGAFENNFVMKIKMILRTVSPEAYLVGDCVRDALFGIEPKDFDFVVNGVSYEELARVFKESGLQTKETGKNFLVLMVSVGEQSCEISLFRKDGTYKDGRRPETVELGTMKEDADRRDFTINSLYYDLYNHEVVDPTGKGLKDLRERVLQFNGKAEERLEEDNLRLLRALRFLQKYNLTWARGTERVFNRLFVEKFSSIDPQRALSELTKMSNHRCKE